MGVYYYFYNTRLELDNKQSLFEYSECSWVAKLDFDDAEYYFKKVLELNPDWLETDKIIAHADYNGYPSYIYENGKLTYKEAEIEETYSFGQKLESEWTNS